jgi:hypothetical protein
MGRIVHDMNIAAGHDGATFMVSRRRALAALVASLALCLAGCQFSGASASPTATPTATAVSGDVWQALRRPLHLPTIAPSAVCPAALERRVTPGFSPAIGDGPVYAAGPWSSGRYSIDGAANKQGWYYLKVLWISRPEYTGPILIRGAQIDGPNALLFGSSLIVQDLLPELQLPAGSGGSDPSGWGNWPSYTMPRAPGCYAYQVDGTSFSEVIVFQVVP